MLADFIYLLAVGASQICGLEPPITPSRAFANLFAKAVML
jgi:hypothetical protein